MESSSQVGAREIAIASAASIDELIEMGEAKIAQIKLVNKEAAQRLEAEEKQRIETFIRLLNVQLPRSIWDYVNYERWHSPDYEYRILWDAQAMIEIPGLAPILVYCRTYHLDEPETATVSLYARNGDEPFEVLEYGCEFNSVDSIFYLSMKSRWVGNDISIALEQAKCIGDHRLEVEEEIEHRNQERAAEPFKQEEVVVSTSEMLLNALKEFISEEIQRQLQARVE